MGITQVILAPNKNPPGAVMTNKNELEITPAFDDAENFPSNKSNNRPFSDVAQATLSRRNVLKGSLAAAGATFLAPTVASAHGYKSNYHYHRCYKYPCRNGSYKWRFNNLEL